jgi:hypothetical protein
MMNLSVDAVCNDIGISSIRVRGSPARPVLVRWVRNEDVVRSRTGAEVVSAVVAQVRGDTVVVLLPVLSLAVVVCLAAVVVQNTGMINMLFLELTKKKVSVFAQNTTTINCLQWIPTKWDGLYFIKSFENARGLYTKRHT